MANPTIVVPDAAATPVNHTFTVSKSSGDSAVLLEKSALTTLGYWALAFLNRGPVAGSPEKLTRVKISLSVPVVYNETINGVNRPSLGYTSRANVEFVFPSEAVLQNRKDLRKLLVGVLNDSQTIAVIETQENFW